MTLDYIELPRSATRIPVESRVVGGARVLNQKRLKKSAKVELNNLLPVATYNLGCQRWSEELTKIRKSPSFLGIDSIHTMTTEWQRHLSKRVRPKELARIKMDREQTGQ